MVHRYSTALSHLILAITSLVCLLSNKNRPNHGYFHYTLGLFLFNSLMGVWRWGNPSYGRMSERVYRMSSFLNQIFALPTLATTIWLANGYPNELGWSHTAISVVPLALYMADHKFDQKIIDLILILNGISLATLSYNVENYYGLAAVVSYIFDHFYIRNSYWNNLPTQDLSNYGLCFFTCFATKAVY